MIVLLALSLITMLAMAGLLVDGGMAWVNRRQAQAAADTAALSAAVAASHGASYTDARLAAMDIAGDNGYQAGNKDCAGVALPNDGVTVNWPPSAAATPAHQNMGFIEVVVTRAMNTAFAGVVGQPCWMVSARAVASIKSHVATCNFCSLSNWDDKYTLVLNNGNDLRVDGDIFSNHVGGISWTKGTAAKNRCGGADPCSATSCGDWIRPGGTTDGIDMCGQSFWVEHNGGGAGNPTILSARTIAAAGGWQARSKLDVIHADQLAPVCPAHPKDMDWTDPFLQETNVCIGAPQIVDPLNDPGNPADIMPLPDYNNLSTCPGGPYPCGPVASTPAAPNNCKPEPGSELRIPTGTFTTPVKLTLVGGTNQKKLTICPGIYYGGFGTSGDGNAQPHIIMLPGTYVMIGGGFQVGGSASITTVSSQGDGVTIYNSGGQEAFTENFPSDVTLIPACTVGACKATDTPVLNPPSTAAILAGASITYKLVVPKGTFVGAPVPTGTAASVKFYNGNDSINPITCTAPTDGVTFTATSLVAKCTTSYVRFGEKGITAVYAGDATYAPTGAIKNQEVNPQPSATQGNIDLRTDGTSTCNNVLWAAWPCGDIVLHAPTGGRYSGLLIFQDRAPDSLEGSGLGIKLQPYLGAAACDMTPVTTPLGVQPAFMANGVAAYGSPFNSLPVPDPCGSLGGLSGTIYAAHQSTGSSDWDAVVIIMGSGLADLQIIGAEIDFTQGNPSHQARFAFDASKFANGMLHLVE